MTQAKTWRVDIYICEDQGRTYAEARLHTELGDRLAGSGRAKVHPADRDIPEIGEELVVAGALTEVFETQPGEVDCPTASPWPSQVKSRLNACPLVIVAKAATGYLPAAGSITANGNGS
jgi:hypothetical protein